MRRLSSRTRLCRGDRSWPVSELTRTGPSTLEAPDLALALMLHCLGVRLTSWRSTHMLRLGMLTACVDMMGFCMQHRHPSRRDAPPGPQLPAALWLCKDAQGV